MKKQNTTPLFEKPTEKNCRLILNDQCSGENGCPNNPGCSCTHGIEGQVCEHGVSNKPLKRSHISQCQLSKNHEVTQCPLYPGQGCVHGIEGQICEHGM